MVKTVSTPGVAAPWMLALATCAPGREARDIQSWGRTKRAKTFPLRPLPLSPEGDSRGFPKGGPLSMAIDTPELGPVWFAESAWFATALELVRTACGKICNAPAGAGRRNAETPKKLATTAELSLVRS